MFRDVIKGVLERRETTYRTLEYKTGIDNGFINRVVNGKKAIPQDPQFIVRICAACGLNPRDFPEYRERIIIEAVRGDPRFLDVTYEQWLVWEASREESREGEAKKSGRTA